MKKIVAIFFLLYSILPSYGQKAKVISAYNYLQFNELENAKEAIDKAIINESTVDWYKTWYYRGLIYQTLYASDTGKVKKYTDALLITKQSYIKAIQIDRRKEFADDAVQKLKAVSFAIYSDGVNNYNQQQFENAYKYFIAVMEINDFFRTIDTNAVFNTALSAEKTGRTEEAKKLYQNLLNYQYKNPDVYQSLSAIYRINGDTITALSVIELGKKLFPENKTLIIDEINLYIISNKMTEASAKIDDAIKMDNQNPDLYFTIATVYDKLNQREKADDAYRKAIQLRPTYFEALYNLGAMYYNNGIETNNEMNQLNYQEEQKFNDLKTKRDKLFADALPFFEKAYLLENSDINLVTVLKEIYLRTGKMEKSEEMKKKLEESRKKIDN